VVDLRSDWALCFRYRKHLPLTLQGLGPTDVFCSKAQRQQAEGLVYAKAQRQRQQQRQQDVGHEG